MDKNTLKISAVGDIMLGRHIVYKIDKTDDCYPFAKIKDELLRDSDVIFGNLESPLSNKGEPVPKKGCTPSFKGSQIFIKNLMAAGFNILNLANNHILDYGVDAAIDTIQLCKKHSIHTLGIGDSLAKAREPVIFSANNINITFIGYTYAYWADYKKFGCAPMIESIIMDDIAKIKSSDSHIIVSLHGGLELIDYPNPSARNLCRKIIDAGASLILRHHPHCLQGIEEYNGGLIAYSLGNFVFDQHVDIIWDSFKNRHFLSRKNPKMAEHFLLQNKVRESCILKCEFDKNGLLSYQTVPIIINDYFEPEIAYGTKKNRILTHIKYISAPLYDEHDKIWKSVDPIYVKLKRKKLILYMLKFWKLGKVRRWHIIKLFNLLRRQ